MGNQISKVLCARASNDGVNTNNVSTVKDSPPHPTSIMFTKLQSSSGDTIANMTNSSSSSSTSLLKQQKPFGSWESPIKSSDLSGSVVNFTHIATSGSEFYYSELRPSEAGRTTILCHSQSKTVEITPDHNVSTRVHEYGGAAFDICNGVLVYSNAVDNKLYCIMVEKGEMEPFPITDDGENDVRYGDISIHHTGKYCLAIQEIHTKDQQVINRLVKVEINKGSFSVAVIQEGFDFYTSPRIQQGNDPSDDNATYCFIAYNHPCMPWTGSCLYISTLNSSSEPNLVSGKHKVEATSQPKWYKDTLFFSSDKSGFFNLYQVRVKSGAAVDTPSLVLGKEFDSDFTTPDWQFNSSEYCILEDSTIFANYNDNGTPTTILINPNDGSFKVVSTQYEALSHAVYNSSSKNIVFVAGTTTSFKSLYTFDTVSNNFTAVKSTAPGFVIDNESTSIARSIEFPGGYYGFYYEPKSSSQTGIQGELPPVIVYAHGGPTSYTPCTFDLKVQYWTTRGFAYLAVNYGGSANFGREYRERLDGQWGKVDVDDCANAALYLSNNLGLVDRQRMAITGNSSGGFTVLAALAFRNDVFTAGSSKYGICDLVSLSKLTHKFESHYLDSLVGGKHDEIPQVYFDRSPINHAESIQCPLLVLQGSLDMVVPREQADRIVEAIKKSTTSAGGAEVEYVVFEGERHGWKDAKNIEKALDVELAFYMRVWKI